MADTPVLDALNVELAYRLGDARKPEGGAVTHQDDGIAYPAVMREQFLTQATRSMINIIAPRVLAGRAEPCYYVGFFSFNKTPVNEVITLDFRVEMREEIAKRIIRIFDVEINGKRALHKPLGDGRYESIYWQNVPRWYVVQEYVSAINGPFTGHWPVLYIEGPRHTSDVAIRVWRQLSVPDLVSGGTEDLLLNSQYFPALLGLAEAIARRTHQEFGPFVKQDAIADAERLKET